MASASCNNADCDRGEWELRKHPDDYKGGVSCPDCGTTRVDIHGVDTREPAERGGRRERRPAPREEPRRERRPARREEPRQGAGAGDVLALFDDDIPTERRAQAASSVLGGLGSIAQQFMEYQAQKKQAQEKRAEEVTLQESNLPVCKTEMSDGEPCGYQFGPEDIGLNSSRVRCPNCNTVYDIEGPA